MSLLRTGLYLLPVPLLGMHALAYAMFAGRPARRSTEGTGNESKLPAAPRNEEAECSVLASYHMGCLAQSMSVCGFDVGAGRICGCERSGDHCIRRMR